ncbi:hypothetical protein J3F83DRAFT_725644, partial [Trichoderma novae-zelandiae]
MMPFSGGESRRLAYVAALSCLEWVAFRCLFAVSLPPGTLELIYMTRHMPTCTFLIVHRPVGRASTRLEYHIVLEVLFFF